MHSVVFMLVGLVFVAVSILGKKIRKQFLSDAINVKGKVVEIVEEKQKSSGSTRTFHLPIVEYKADSTYRFKGEVDVNRHYLKVGDVVEVLVSKSNSKVAKLKVAGGESTLLLNVFLTLGTIGCGLSIYLFDPDDYNFSFLKEPFNLLVIAGFAFFLIFKGYPALKIIQSHGLKYSENAYSVTNEDLE